MEKQKMSFFKRILHAIKDFERYQDFALEDKSVAIRYIMKLVLILTIVISICFMISVAQMVKKGINYFRNDFPNLYFSNNELTIESNEPIIHELDKYNNGIIVFDTSSTNEEIDYKEKIELYENSIVFSKDSVTLKNVKGTNTYSYSSISDLYGIGNFNKQDIESLLTNKNVYTFYLSLFIILLIYTYVVYIITTMLDAVMLAIFGFMSSRISRVPLKFSVIYKMSLYALTLPILLNIIYIIINWNTGFIIEYFDWMYTAIAFIYLITAILIIKDNMIKQQMELLKIEEEQKRIREEQKRKEEEEREKKEKEKREREKAREEKEKKKEGKTKQDPAPEGT